MEWHLVPTVWQHFKSQVERMIGLLKKQIWWSFEEKKHTHKETATILQEGAQIINSRPLMGGPWAEGDPLSPEDLMLGRAKVGIPAVHLETGQQLVKRFRVIQQAKEEFWDRWVKEIFPSSGRMRPWLAKRTSTPEL